MTFRWPWREYQARVLDELPTLLQDGRLHVVAAPGSGKTVVGIELFRRLARPTVVMSPTRTIRDQWLDRLRDFLPPDQTPDPTWRSRDLAELRFFNSITYQALHTRAREQAAAPQDLEAAATGESDDEAEQLGPSGGELQHVIDLLRVAQIKVLILDEAHHLRASWWTALQQIVAALDGLTVIALTATPPYDVQGHEFARYLELCGPIDAEISVPELVKAGTLCPHDDYIWLTEADGADSARLAEHRRMVELLGDDVMHDAQVVAELAAHPWARQPRAHAAQIAGSPETALALARLLHSAGTPSEALQAVLGAEAGQLGRPGPVELELVLHEYLFARQWEHGPGTDRRQLLSKRLRADGLLWRREWGLDEPGRGWPQLNLSRTKVDACVQIHELEAAERGDELRQVILTDYIRDDDHAREQPRGLSLGAWPIFHRLAARPGDATGLVLHTGRLTVVHQDLITDLRAAVDGDRLQVQPVASLARYRQVTLAGGQRLTGALTALLAEGRINVIVATRALLGEGWDAPQVNSLVLASFVGSFMTTNQMRGRAIRTDPAQPGKVASIWHLATYAEVGDSGWDCRDIEEMAERFETFCGIAENEPALVTGLGRVGVDFYSRGRCQVPIDAAAQNAVMAARLRDRQDRAQRWHAVLAGPEGRILPSVALPVPPKFRVLRFRGTLAALMVQLAIFVSVALLQVMELLGRGPATIAPFLVVALLATAVTGPKLVRAAILWLRFLPVDGAIEPIANAVRDALCDTGLIPATLRDAPIVVRRNAMGVYHVALGGGTFAERSLFADSVHQVLAPIRKPRYLITRSMDRWSRQQTDYHAVPAVLGLQAERAQAFLRAWRRHVTPAELVFTRSDVGRAALIHAQTRSFAAAAQGVAKRMDYWF